MPDRGPNRAYLSLGSNIEPDRNLPAAVRELSRFGRLERISRVWESPPVGFEDQPNFLNLAVLLETKLSAAAICADAIAAVEQLLGRVRDPRNKSGPRTIDVDLLLFNREVFRVGRRSIPDPDILTRAFVAVPLAELHPDYVHPTDGRTLAEIAALLSSTVDMIPRPDVKFA